MEIIEVTCYFATVARYEYFLELCKEMNIAILDIKPAPKENISYGVLVQGDKDHIDFAMFLVKKKAKWIDKVIGRSAYND